MSSTLEQTAFANTVPTINLSFDSRYNGNGHVRPNSESLESSEQLRFLGWIKKLHS